VGACLAATALAGCGDTVCNDVESGDRYSVTVTATEAFPSNKFDPPGLTVATPSCGPSLDLSVGSHFTVKVRSIEKGGEGNDCLGSTGHVEDGSIGSVTLSTDTNQGALSASDPGLIVSQDATVGSCSGVWTAAFWASGSLTSGAHLARGFRPVSTTGCEAIAVGGSTEFPRCEDAFTVTMKKR
jgi:hypothetical protein